MLVLRRVHLVPGELNKRVQIYFLIRFIQNVLVRQKYDGDLSYALADQPVPQTWPCYA